MSGHLLDVLDRHGRVVRSVTLCEQPTVIGRAPGSDILLDDPFVCAQHACIEPGNPPRLRDLQSVNGSYVKGTRERVLAVDLPDGAEFRVGHTQLRLREIGANVAPAQPDPLLTSPLFRLDQPRVALLLAALLTGLLLAQSVLTSSKLEPWPHAFSAAVLPAMLALLTWALMVALLNRLLAERMHFAGHFALAAAGVIVFSASGVLVDLLAFAFALDQAHEWIQFALELLILLGVLYGHARLISRAPAQQLRRQLAVAASLPLLIVGFATWAGFQDDTFNARPDLNMLISNPNWSLSRGESTQHWERDAKKLREELLEK